VISLQDRLRVRIDVGMIRSLRGVHGIQSVAMKMNAAVLWGLNEKWSVEEVELDGPKEAEVLVEYEATGLCHSDHHARTGDMPLELPLVGGHEGAGIVQEVGPGVRNLKVGDHVVGTFLPACGRCRWCSNGQSNLCDLGMNLASGGMLDGTYRLHGRERDIGAYAWLGTFAPYGTVPEASLVKIDNDHPLDRACLVGCGVSTGWGSAVNTAQVSPGDTVVVIGCGGIGSAAIQGARLAGAEKIVVVDIAEDKKDKALQFGATHFAGSLQEATAMVGELTRGVMADSALVTVGVVEGTMIVDALNIVRKGGAVVVTALASFMDPAPALPMSALAILTIFQKRLLGSLYGETNPRADIPRLLSLYREGKLLLDEAVTTEYKLADVNEAYDDMLGGRIIRGVVKHEH
jgi:NDMA-dependent alcohol dehydrogenase